MNKINHLENQMCGWCDGIKRIKRSKNPFISCSPS